MAQTPTPVRRTPAVTMTSKPAAPLSTATSSSASAGNTTGWAIAGIALLFSLILLSQCSTKQTAVTNAAADTNYTADMTNAVAAQSPPAPQPINAASVSLGASHLRLAFAAENFSGAMVYSQNCYDALAHEFTWAKLDQCGAFDALAVRSLGNTDLIGFDNESAWFQSETAAARYLAAATGAGQASDETDRRYSDLQARVSKMRTVGQTSERESPGITDPMNAVQAPSDNQLISVEGEE